MQILSGKLTDKQEFICEVAVLGRALTKTFIHIPFVVTVMLRHHCDNKRKTKQNTRKQEGLVLVFFFVFPVYGRVLCTNKRLYVRLSRTGSRKT